jgi:hypothetical protein
MSSVKRRKIDEDSSSALAKTKKIYKTVRPAPATTSASPEPAIQPSQETTTSDAEAQKDVLVQKTFKDLVSSSLLLDDLYVIFAGHHRFTMRRLYRLGI